MKKKCFSDIYISFINTTDMRQRQQVLLSWVKTLKIRYALVLLQLAEQLINGIENVKNLEMKISLFRVSWNLKWAVTLI